MRIHFIFACYNRITFKRGLTYEKSQKVFDDFVTFFFRIGNVFARFTTK